MSERGEANRNLGEAGFLYFVKKTAELVIIWGYSFLQRKWMRLRYEESNFIVTARGRAK